jgi:methyl-accepting chemotaxis protein
MSIKQKITATTAIPILAMLVLAVLGWQSLKQLQGSMSHVVQDRFMVLIDQEITPLITQDMLPVINEDVARIQGLTNSIQLMLEADRDAHQALIAEKTALVAGKEQLQTADATNLENIEQIEQRMGQAAAGFDADDVKTLYASFRKAFAEWKSQSRNVVALAGSPDQNGLARHSSEEGSAFQAFDVMRGHIDQLQQLQEAQVQKAMARLAEKKEKINAKEKTIAERRLEVNDTTQAALNRASFMVILFIVLGVSAAVLAGVISVLFTRSIIGPLNRIIAGLTQGAEQVFSAAGQVSSASQSLAEGATEQAAGLQETSSSLEEMSSMTQRNAGNAGQANTLATEARGAAGAGTESMNRMNDAILAIQKSSDETAKILKAIDEIAFQTNLLALNAAVEAARAGEAGKGFAVVAEEVRNLAMRSAEAAKNTAGMIEESVRNSKNGVDIAVEVAKVLSEIVERVGKTTDLVGEIASASQEQARGIEQVNTAVSQMDKVTQQNAANAEESASASEELTAQARSLDRIVGELVTLVGGAAPQGNSAGATQTGRGLRREDIERKLVSPASSRGASRRAGKSDEVFHAIAGHPRGSQKPAHRTDDLSEFNG